MRKQFQRKSFFALLLCLNFTYCGSAKKPAGENNSSDIAVTNVSTYKTKNSSLTSTQTQETEEQKKAREKKEQEEAERLKKEQEEQAAAEAKKSDETPSTVKTLSQKEILLTSPAHNNVLGTNNVIGTNPRFSPHGKSKGTVSGGTGGSGSGNPGAGNPGAGNPGAGNPAGNNPAGNNPAANNPAANNPAGNNPAGNNPAANNPAGNNPAGNNPAANNPAGNNPAGNNPAGAPVTPPVATVPNPYKANQSIADIFESAFSKYANSAPSNFDYNRLHDLLYTDDQISPADRQRVIDEYFKVIESNNPDVTSEERCEGIFKVSQDASIVASMAARIENDKKDEVTDATLPEHQKIIVPFLYAFQIYNKTHGTGLKNPIAIYHVGGQEIVMLGRVPLGENKDELTSLGLDEAKMIAAIREVWESYKNSGVTLPIDPQIIAFANEKDSKKRSEKNGAYAQSRFPEFTVRPATTDSEKLYLFPASHNKSDLNNRVEFILSKKPLKTNA